MGDINANRSPINAKRARQGVQRVPARAAGAKRGRPVAGPAGLAAPRPSPPASVTSASTAWAGVAGLLAGWLALRDAPIGDLSRTALLMLAAVAPMICIDVAWHRVHRRASTGLAWDGPPAGIDCHRLGTKLVGLLATVSVVAFAYLLLREYAKPFYRPYWSLLALAAPCLALGVLPYIVLVDRRQRDPQDALWHVGRCVLGTPAPGWRAVVADHARTWLIKAFFLPLMAVYAVAEVAQIGDRLRAWHQTPDFTRLFELAWAAIFTIDVMFGTIGYVMTLRALDAHVRSAEPTLLGWLVTVICYQPIWGFLAASYFTYQAGPAWHDWLAGTPLLRTLWGGAILALMAIYVWSTVSFGYRFSNLTFRGVVTSGPYRYVRHPAYLSKNIAYWLIATPWMASGGFGESVRCCLLLLAVNAIYVARAWTEERHLGRDPGYRAYVDWVRRHGLPARLRRVLPGAVEPRG